MHFNLIFKNGTMFTSPNIFSKDPGWASEENGLSGGIREMNIPITKDKAIVLHGFEKYNFFIEATQNLSGKPVATIKSFCFCGATRGKIILYRIDPVKLEIAKIFCKDGKEYAGSPTRGWREGIFDQKSKEGICSI